MQSPAVLDFDHLAAPIAEDAPTGVDLREADSTTYYNIREARRNARNIERDLERGEPPDTKNPLDWGKVLHPCVRALTDKTKDLELAAYVIEALVRMHAAAGLRDGFRLARKLVETFWDGLYPKLQEEEDSFSSEKRMSAAERVSMLAGLNGDAEREGALVPPLRGIVIARSSRAGDVRFLQYQDAVLRRREADLEAIQSAANDTDAGFYQTLHADLTACLEEFTRLTVALDQRCGSDSPPSSTMRELLESLEDCVRKLAGGKLTGAPTGEADADPAKKTDAAQETGKKGGSDVLRTREDAFHTLQKVAEFFRRTEPHSVLSYALEQVVRWGKTPLPELLTELIGDPGTRDAMFKQVGIKPPEVKSD